MCKNIRASDYQSERSEGQNSDKNARDLNNQEVRRPDAKAQAMIDEYEGVKRGINGMIRRISEKRDVFGKKGSRKL